MRWRSGYAAAALSLLAIEAAIALWLDDAVIRPHVGDALAVMLVHCGLRSVSPAGWRADLALAIVTAFAIEFGQYAGVLHRLGWESRPAARLILGTSYDPRDLLSYAAGAAVIWCVERRRASRQKGSPSRRVVGRDSAPAWQTQKPIPPS